MRISEPTLLDIMSIGSIISTEAAAICAEMDGCETCPHRADITIPNIPGCIANVCRIAVDRMEDQMRTEAEVRRNTRLIEVVEGKTLGQDGYKVEIKLDGRPKGER